MQYRYRVSVSARLWYRGIGYRRHGWYRPNTIHNDDDHVVVVVVFVVVVVTMVMMMMIAW